MNPTRLLELKREIGLHPAKRVAKTEELIERTRAATTLDDLKSIILEMLEP